MSAASGRRPHAPLGTATYERTGLVRDKELTWVPGAGGREVHDRVLAGMPVMSFIVGGSIKDDAVRIRTSPPDERRSGGKVIRFDDVVGPGGVRLNGPGMEHHLVTAKVLLNSGLQGPLAWTTSDIHMKAFFRSFTLLIRFMGANGIHRMADLREPHFRLFHKLLATGGLEALFPVLPRLDAYLGKVLAGKEAFPTYTDGWRSFLSMDGVARKLGLARGGNLSKEAARRIAETAAKAAPGLLVQRSVQASERVGARVPSQDGRLTRSRIAEILEPWERLYDCRARLSHDMIGYRAFTPLMTREKVSAALGRDTGRTRDIPVDVLGLLLDRALRCLDYGTHVRQLRDAVSAARAEPDFDSLSHPDRARRVRSALSAAMAKAPKGPGAPSRMSPVYASIGGGVRERPDLRTVLSRLLPGACFILIAAFSARRKTELESLRGGCIVRESGDPWLMAWVGKSMREVDRIPVPECVARAVEHLEWLSEDARRATGEDWLFSFKKMTTGGMTVAIDVDRAMNDFAQFIGVPETIDGKVLKLAPHQMRRAFAILYFYRFRMPSLSALSFFLRHYDPGMTARYLTDAVAGTYRRILEENDSSEEVLTAAKTARAEHVAAAEAFEEVAEDFLVEVLTLAERGEEPMVGKGGEALMLDLEHYLVAASGKVSVSGTGEDEGERSLDQLIRGFARGTRTRIVSNPGGTSSCLCGSDPHRLGLANCLKRKEEREGPAAVAAAREPDFAYAEPGECGDCYNGVQLPEHDGPMSDYVKSQMELSSEGAAPMLREVAAKRAATVEGFRLGFYGRKVDEPGGGDLG